jgi:hypothetical protein
MKDMKKLLGDDSSPGDDMKNNAKLKVLKHLKDMASKMMGDDVKGGMEGLKKVTVAAPDKAGLKLGLDKAKELIGHKPEESLEDPLEEANETPEEESMEDHDEEHMSLDEINAEIQHLIELKKQLTLKEGMNP